MFCYSFIFVLLMASLFNTGDAVLNFTNPDGGDGSAVIDENSSAGSAVKNITADGGTTVNYTLVTTDTPFALTVSGALTVGSAVLDFETTSTYKLLIRAEYIDNGTAASATATLTVSVQDVNELPSYDETSYSVCVTEGSSVGTTVITLPATDPDNGTMLTYNITDGDHNRDFNISTTYLKIAKALNSTAAKTYNLTIQVSDESLDASANFVVTVASTCSGASALAVSLTTLLLGLVYALNLITMTDQNRH